MDRLIREMSYLFTKQRFLELQETAKDIAIGHSDFPECFGLIADAIAEFVEDTPDDEWREHEKNHYALRCNAIDIAMGKGHKVTDIQWAHPGWFGTAEKGDTTQ